MAGTRRDIPTELRAQPVLDRFAQLTTATIKRGKDKQPRLDPGPCGMILARLTRHLDIARNHPSEPDGYPTKASGADAGTTTSGGARWDPDADVALTSVEGAVDARTRHNDDHDLYTALAWGHFVIATNAIASALQVLEKLDGLTTPTEGLGLQDDRWCENHLRYGITHGRDDVRGTKACRWCSEFRADVGSYPPRELVEKHDNGQRIYNRDIVAHFPDYGKVSGAA